MSARFNGRSGARGGVEGGGEHGGGGDVADAPLLAGHGGTRSRPNTTPLQIRFKKNRDYGFLINCKKGT